MADHDVSKNKPTKEELKAKQDEAIAMAEELEENTEEKEEEEAEPEEEESESATPPVSDDDSSGDEEENGEDEEEKEEEEAEPSKEVKERLKKEVEEKNAKLSASARENQKIYAKNRVINSALIEADEIPEPTEEELIKEFPDWELMGDTEKIFAKETVISRNWRNAISKAKEQATKIEKWNTSVEEYIENPETLNKIPALEGKQEEFKAFATKEENNSVPFNILTSAFLFEYSKGKKENKGRMFERGSGGPNDKPKPKGDKLTVEEGRILRETNYDLWKEKLKAGKIESNF